MQLKLYKRLIPFILPFLLLLVGLYLVPIKIFDAGFSKMPGDLGDTRFNNYILEHGHKVLTGKTDKYWDAPFMYPYKNVIALSDNLLGTVPVYSVFRMSGMDRDTAFQYWILVMFALNFICCFYALNKWSKNVILASVGAYIFAFSLYNVGQIGHAQIFPKFMVPLIFYWCWKYLTERQVKYFLLTALALVYQFYCGIYLGFFSVYILLFLIIAYFVTFKDWAFFHQFKKLKTTGYHLAIIVFAGFLLIPLMKPYLDVAHTLGMRKFENTVSSIPRLESYFFPPYATYFWGYLYEQSAYAFQDWWDHVLFIGFLPWIGILFIPFVLSSKENELSKRKLIACLSLALFLSFIFCLNLGEFTLYRIIFEIPGFSSMRAINRVINTEIIFFVVIFVFVFNELSKSNRVIKWVVMSFPLLVVMDNMIYPDRIQRFDKLESQAKIEEIKKNISSQYNAEYAAFAYLPILPPVLNEGEDLHRKIIEGHINVMLAAQELNLTCVNAYTGSYPGNYMPFFDHKDDVTLKNWFEFNNANIKTVQFINDIGKKEKSRAYVSLQATNNKFACAEENHGIIVNRDKPAAWEIFSIIRFENGDCVVRAYTGKYFCCDLYKDNSIEASREKPDTWETFSVTDLDSNYVAFKAVNGKYLSLDEKSQRLFAKGETIGKNEKFKLIVQ